MRKIYTTIVLTCIALQLFAQNVSIIPASSSWKYLDNGSNQGTAWRAASFNDASWPTSNAEFGYGDGDETTIVNFGPNASMKYRTTYFRKTFTIADPAAYSSFVAGLLMDDGAVVYINGTEVIRSNLPATAIGYRTFASSNIAGAPETVFNNFTINAAVFVAGTNTIAVEIHQSSNANADLSFNLRLDATPIPVCNTPTGLTATAITANAATLNWQIVPGASNYNVQYRIVGTSSWTLATSTSTPFVANTLLPSSNYEFQVQALCSIASAYSSSFSFTTLPATPDTLIKTNSSWKYLANGSNQGTAWRSGSFNDASWSSGNAELGYGDGGEATVVSYGPSSTAKYITTYFRKSFSVNNPSLYTSLTLGMVRDDGIVVYLNGTEVYRNNMPTGTIGYTTRATTAIGGADESAWITTSLNVSSLLQGTNVLAVEIHQQAPNSSDISFNALLYASSQPVVPVVTRGAYLQKLTPNGITIRWRTDVACNSVVQFGTTPAFGNTVTDAVATTEHIVNLTGLSPATLYYYAIGTTTQVLQGNALNCFYTAPLTGSTNPMRIWVTGDFGNGSTAQTAVRNAYAAYTGATPTNLWLWLGDNAYNNGTDNEFQNNVFNRYPDQLKSIPLFPSPGNHDYGDIGYQSTSALTTSFPYFSIFSVPQNAEAGGLASGTPKYYSYNYGNVHFISLDSYGALNSSTSPMYTWLNADLAANTQRWTVVYFHHPPYTKGSHNSDTETELIDMRNRIIPLLESYHVDLVLAGHSHTNERSFLIKGHYGLASSFLQSMKIGTSTNTYTKSAPFDGTVYAVCGTSGQSPGTTASGYPMSCMAFNNNSNNCSMVLDITGDLLSAKFLTSTGTIVDQFTITKSGSGFTGRKFQTGILTATDISK